MTRGGKRFYITFIDDYSRYTRVYLLRNKDEARDVFIKYINEVENQLSKKIKRLRTDRGGEYESNPFNSFYEDHRIIHETTPPYSPKFNEVAKRKNRTLKRNDEYNVGKFRSTLELVEGSYPIRMSYSK